MTQPERDAAPPNVQRPRGTQKRDGMKLMRMWVPDPATPEFQAELARQAAILNDADEEEEIQRFIEAVMEWPEP